MADIPPPGNQPPPPPPQPPQAPTGGYGPPGGGMPNLMAKDSRDLAALALLVGVIGSLFAAFIAMLTTDLGEGAKFLDKAVLALQRVDWRLLAPIVLALFIASTRSKEGSSNGLIAPLALGALAGFAVLQLFRFIAELSAGGDDEDFGITIAVVGKSTASVIFDYLAELVVVVASGMWAFRALGASRPAGPQQYGYAPPQQ